MTSSKEVFVANSRIFFSPTPLFPLTYRDIDVPVIMATAQVPRFQDNRHMNVVWLSTLRTGRLYHK